MRAAVHAVALGELQCFPSRYKGAGRERRGRKGLGIVGSGRKGME